MNQNKLSQKINLNELSEETRREVKRQIALSRKKEQLRMKKLEEKADK